MEILLLIAIIAVGASGLYVAATFNSRTRQNFAPLMDDAAKNIGKEIAATRGELGRQMQAITDDVRQSTDPIRRLEAASGKLQEQVQAHADELRDSTELLRRLEAASGELRQQMQAHADELRDSTEPLRRLEAASGELRQQMQTITDEVRRNSELVKHLDEQFGARQNQLGEDLAQLDHRVAEFSDSLTHQSSRISGIYRYVIRQETLAGSSAENDSLLLAMLEAESYEDDKGWGGRPHLYALTEKTSTVAADRESAAGIRGARHDALVLVNRGRLPDGDLVEVVAGIHWPADVVGCVLVTELAALSPGGEEYAPIDPVAAGQWTSVHPDGRAARLAVGIRRSGEHKCGLRIKGEDEMHARTDLASDLVAALLRTF
jgi:hypothetical protein